MGKIKLEKYFQKNIQKEIAESKAIIINGTTALDILKTGFNANNAEYRITLFYRYNQEFGPPVKIKHKGSLEDAIKKAEQKAEDESEQIESCFVKVRLGKTLYRIPKEIWGQYAKDNYRGNSGKHDKYILRSAISDIQ